MNKKLLTEIIFDQHELIRNFHITERECSFDLNANYVVIGLRRAGKSTILYKLARDLVRDGVDWNQIIYINFEDERLEGFTAADFNDILVAQSELSDKKGWFFFDEIQNIDGWEKFARRMADSKEHIFITGSNAKMLSSEVERMLGGRFLTKYVTPYNFREFLTAKKIDFGFAAQASTKSRGKIIRALQEYFYFGGFPESLVYQNRREYVSSIYQKILLGDIAARHAIRNTTALKIMMKKIAECVKDELSYSKLHNILRTIGVSVSKDSVIDYVSYAQDSYLLFAVRNYFSKFVDKETTPKYYYNDNGLLNLFLIKEEPRLLENLTAITLKNKHRGELYFLKSSDFDIDFFVADTGTAFQVTYSLSDNSIGREIAGLVKASRAMSEARRFVIITYDEETTIEQDGITIDAVPIWRLMLDS